MAIVVVTIGAGTGVSATARDELARREICSGLRGAANVWCLHNPAYWRNKAREAVYLGNRNVRIGVNLSYGGAIFELYGRDGTKNLISEHGGAAMQLSLWGYDATGRDGGRAAWFRVGSCDPMGYDERPATGTWERYSLRSGAHVADCKAVFPCGKWGAGAPFNPLQARGANCGWNDESNDVTIIERSDSRLVVEHRDLNNFTKSSRFVGLVIRQTVEVHEHYAVVMYDVAYEGMDLTEHGQEIPAIFTGAGVSGLYFAGENGKVTRRRTSELAGGVRGALEPIPSDRWWGVCNEEEDYCLTVMTPSERVTHIRLRPARDGLGAYIGARGRFALIRGFSFQVKIYLFPLHPESRIDNMPLHEYIGEIRAGRAR